MNLVQSKVFSAVSIGVSSFFIGVVPNCFAHQGRSQWPLLLSNLLCFGGGVLLATSLVHILQELRESLPDNYKQYAEVLYCIGFFILYVVDEVVHYMYADSEGEAASILHSHSHNGSRPRSYGTLNRNDEEPERRLSIQSNSRTESDSELLTEQIPTELSQSGRQELSTSTRTSNLGLLVALSVHALFEGLIVGLEPDPNKVLLLLGAICCHKLVVSFCLGAELASSPFISLQRHFIYILIFSGGSSAGILVGMAISNLHGAIKSFVIPILEAFAGGTLLYITVSEILPRERTKWHQQHEKKFAGILQLLSFIAGFSFMTLSIVYLESN